MEASPRPGCDIVPQMPDPSAAQFDFLMRGHVPALYRYAYRWTGDVHQAEDLVQEALTRLYPELPRLLQIERLRPWVARVMYRIFVDGLRRARRSPVLFVGRSGSTGALLEDEDEDERGRGRNLGSRRSSPSGRSNASESSRRGRACTSSTASCCRCMKSRGTVSKKWRSIIEVPLGTAKSRLHRARNHLRALLTEGTNSPAPTCKPSETS